MTLERCEFNQIVDLGTGNSTYTQCPLCGAYRTLKRGEEGEVYTFFRAHDMPVIRRKESSWKRVGNEWRWIEDAPKKRVRR